METGESGPQAEEMIRHGLTVQIVDEPATRGRRLHPAEKANNLRIRQMMREQSREDDIGIACRVIGERIANHPVNTLAGRGRLPGCSNSVGIQIDAGQRNCDPALGGPRSDTAQHIAIAAPYIHDAQRSGRPGSGVHQLVEPAESRPMREGKGVHSGNIVQTRAKLGVAAGLVHHLDQFSAT